MSPNLRRYGGGVNVIQAQGVTGVIKRESNADGEARKRKGLASKPRPLRFEE
jgi:hypothetical protein